MSIKNVLKKTAELFVELPDEQPDISSLSQTPLPASSKPVSGSVTAVSVKQIVERTPGPNLDEITLTDAQAQEAMAPGGMPDFEKVYAKASLPKASFGAEQAIEVISSLPAELPLQVKRATVQATLSAMGKAMNQSESVNTESVVADTSRKMAALSAYEDSLNLQSKKHIAAMQLEIKSYEDRITALNGQIAKTEQLLATAIEQCRKENEKLDEVLEFFTLDIGASKNAQPSN